MAFNPRGRTLATAGTDGTARLWDVTDPRHPTPLSTAAGHTDAVYSVAFSPDGHRLATASKDNTARLWDTTDPTRPTPIGALTGHRAELDAVAFAPDGRTLATAGADTAARLWRTDPQPVADQICATAYPRITRSEWDRYSPDIEYRPPCP